MRSAPPPPAPQSRASVLAAAARRFAVLLGGIAGVTVVVAALLGLVLGAAVNRSVSLGLYGVGSFLLLAGFFFGSRGPVRLGDGTEPGAGGRRVYWASRDERLQGVNESAIYVSLGFVLIVIGLAVDARVRLL
jgi:hypothetical protein